MTSKLLLAASAKFLLGVVLIMALVFLPAGTLAYANGWMLMGLLFVPMLTVGIVLVFRSPALLQKRLNNREKQQDQSRIVRSSGLMFLLGFLIAGFGVRFDWYVLPFAFSVASSVVFLIGYVLYAEVLRENAYLSRTIEVQEGQKVVDTGLYGMVRHPMYAATLLMFMSIPIILGSLYALVPFLSYLPLIAYRIKGEEALLEKELDGYRDYKLRVKYRLIPYIW